jgi:aerobic-type carbon monoxide dehydrogenase small subunit (CoxS/CutS family)
MASVLCAFRPPILSFGITSWNGYAKSGMIPRVVSMEINVHTEPNICRCVTYKNMMNTAANIGASDNTLTT